ncbi:MAG: hypothetical protein AMXMBFR12_06570 [Candidatus Babeliales bacterium]
MKNIKKFTQIALIIAVLGALSAYPLYRTFNQQKSDFSALFEQLNNSESVSETVNLQLKNDHNQCLEAIREAFNIDRKDWQEALSKIEKIKKSDDLKGPSRILCKDKSQLAQRIHKILIKHGINPARVTIEYISKPNSACDAKAGQAYSKNKVLHFLQINTPVLEQKPDEIQEALLTHEIMHLINYDSIEYLFIETLLKKYCIKAEEYVNHPALVAYNKHIEFRADLFAGSNDLHIAQGLKNAFELHIQKFPNAPVSQSHPSSHARLDTMNQLVAHLQNEQKQVVVA